jgi:hypothetical protein
MIDIGQSFGQDQPMKTYVIRATCRYVVKNKETGETESGHAFGKFRVKASSKGTAIRKLWREQKEYISSEWWPVVSFTLIPELVNVI